MSYIKSFKSFQKAEEKASQEVDAGANPQVIEEDNESLLTDSTLKSLRDQKRALEKQLEQLKQQEDNKIKELTAKAEAEVKAKQAAQNAAVNQPAAPATPTAPTV
jgi:hypothetical protein